jgi:threonine synthase
MTMGLPVSRLICASNRNNVLTDFVKTGVYNKNRNFEKTISPSMDILVSSNLERFLYHMSNRNSKDVVNMMSMLGSEGSYRVSEPLGKKIRQLIWAGYSSDKDTMKTIKSVYKEYGYLIDTHTAVAVDVYDRYVIKTGDVLTKTIIASTASPFKFNKSVAEALFDNKDVNMQNEYQLLEGLAEFAGVDVPKALKEIDKLPAIHNKKCKVTDMKKVVIELMGI